MTIGERDRRALMALGGAVALALIIWIGTSPSSSSVKVVAPVESPDQVEKRLDKLRQTAATVPAKEEIYKQVSHELAEREKGMILADTAAQAQARLLQIVRTVAQNQAPPLEVRQVELSQPKSFGDAYGEVAVSITVDCRTDQLVNFISFLSAQPELLSTEDIRFGLANMKQKSMPVRLTIAAIVPRKLIPEKKGGIAF
ncbi:MAG TPA: type II secretion system protein GspM [Bryobacteraceae bacterium]|nr:type II secretion system protein GspM [Bryobacteraceae bacterium]